MKIKKIYDISQEVFDCEVYGGDPPPKRKVFLSMEKGDLYNLTAFEMCAHSALTGVTYIDNVCFYQTGNKLAE